MNNKTHEFSKTLYENQNKNWVRAIDSSKIINWIDDLFNILFPEKTVETIQIELMLDQNKINFVAILTEINNGKSVDECWELADSFYEALPELYSFMQQDAQAILDTDPAADCIQEIINSYPGFLAIEVYRIANAIASRTDCLLPRILTEYAHSKTGIDIHPNATIDVPFMIDHGTGIVIGESTIIGKHVSIYQGVTLGALQVEKNMQEKKRHPTVEDHVIIYANATILGGSTIIGNHSVVGGNTFITKSVNPYSLVMQSNKNTVLNQQEIKDINFFSI
ncbi:serine O-acetyltransferase [Flavobacterium micromati]|jgi:serine O-acetyltransferase|uniref:Serine acetyltransferase n=1 Tax=Flavobacterium micromati TaxID=229205 RepID=A0A1M5QGT6_9FLAO|nr:serine O-acetyltransferase [Flavobacterium micromati]MCL6460509.1 serine acetyltransferase [Flavobacterium micromati]SHH13424.1 serine O-acetyltransferase [Flavobacterium micromati]